MKNDCSKIESNKIIYKYIALSKLIGSIKLIAMILKINKNLTNHFTAFLIRFYNSFFY
jgi:hypothetical protein